jgi:hypothetical protein
LLWFGYSSIIPKAHVLKELKYKTLTTPNVGDHVEQQELSFFASRNAKWYNILEGRLPVSYKAKHNLTK